MRFLSVGEILWDIFPGAEHLGGASLNLAFHLARLGHDVAMVTAVGEDERGRRALELVREAGIDARFIQSTAAASTGGVRVALDDAGRPDYRLERPAAYDFTNVSTAAAEEIAAWKPDWVCFGTLFHKLPEVVDSTRRLLAACPGAGRFYDVNLRPEQYSAPLVRDLSAMAQVLKLSEEEAPEFARLLGLDYSGRETFLRRLAATFGLRCVCLTRGKDGCAVLWGGDFGEYPSVPVTVADTVGAGDAFAAAFLHGWSAGWQARKTADFANRVGGLVAGRHGATPMWSPADLQAL